MTGPVWHAWEEAPFLIARETERPVLLLLTTRWCAWCGEFEREALAATETADRIARDFVPVRVDADLRPDLDARYRAAVRGLTGQSGWPLVAILDHDGRVFYGGTFFPAEGRYGRRGFAATLDMVRDLWRHRRKDAERTARELADGLAANESPPPFDGSLDDAVATTVSALPARLDHARGGFGDIPKFPILPAHRLALRHPVEHPRLFRGVLESATHMAWSALWDPLAGGWHRYCDDRNWRLPHFEKRLVDQAGWIDFLLDLDRITGERHWRERGIETVRFVLGPLRNDDRFRAATVAQGTWRRGGAEVWSDTDWKHALGREDRERSERWLERAYGTDYTPTDHFVLALVRTPPRGEQEEWERIRNLLRAERDARLTERFDDRPFTAETALAAAALLRAARAWDLPEADTAARAVVDSLLEGVYTPGRPMPRLPDGTDLPPFLADTAAAMGLAIEAGREGIAADLAATIDRDFTDGDVFRDAPRDAAAASMDAVWNPVRDAAVPSPAALAIEGIGRLAACGRFPTDRARTLAASHARWPVRIPVNAAGIALAIDNTFRGHVSETGLRNISP